MKMFNATVIILNFLVALLLYLENNNFYLLNLIVGLSLLSIVLVSNYKYKNHE
jgi:hypothetical protein